MRPREMWRRQPSWSLFVLLILAMVGLVQVSGETKAGDSVSRDDFPTDFVFGSGTSAYQVEGAVAEDGRTPSSWDTFAHSGGAMDKSNADITSDQYHKYKEDVKLMADTGLEAYRFSISWSRVIPNGRGPVNPKGIEYYNNLINELLSHGIEPHVTLFHYDLPQQLEDEYEGWLSVKILKDFTAFADVCFREFGDRVSHWTTVNEANVFILGGYDIGVFPPVRCSPPFGFKDCKAGNSTVEPYIATHNILLAHASVARLYRNKYQAKQRGLIGINVFAYSFLPLTNKTEDIMATQRANDFYVGWYLDPLMFGDYPESMKKNAGSRLPSFTPSQSKQVKGSTDFVAVNYYLTVYVRDDPTSLNHDQRDYVRDMAAELIYNIGGPPIPGQDCSVGNNRHFLVKSSWIQPSVMDPFTPSGMHGLLGYIKQAYDNPLIYIHENGLATKHDDPLLDLSRVKYLLSNIHSLLRLNGSNVKGYFTWSFLDVYELFFGYQSSYGLYYVDFNSPDLQRHPKLSVRWYSKFLKGTRRKSKGKYSYDQ